jgi:hypothetical protein
MQAFNAGLLPEALVAFRRVVTAPANDSDPLVSLSRFYAAEASHTLGYQQLLASDIDAALGYFSEALGWNDHFPELQFHTAVALTWNDEVAAARGQLESALVQNPDHFEARVLLAELAFRDSAWAEGELFLQQASDRGCNRAVDEVLVQLLRDAAHPSITALLQQTRTASLRHLV